MYNETQGLLEVKFSTILGLDGSYQFLLYPQWQCHSFKWLFPATFPPISTSVTLKILWSVLPFFPIPQILGNHWSFYCFHSFIFSRMSCSWTHTAFNFLKLAFFHISQFNSVAQSCPTLCDPLNRSTPGLPVHHQLPESTQTHVHCVNQWCHPTISSSVIPFSSCPQSFPASGSFQMS